MPAGQISLMSARPGPDLAATGWCESEYAVRGRASSYGADTADLPADGRWRLTTVDEAEFVTRVVVRRPQDPAAFDGTVVVEWLNVSSGQDACPDWTYLADELVRAGSAWVGVSAQHAGVEGGGAIVPVPGMEGGLKGLDAERYSGLHHPGDAYCYDIFTRVAAALGAPGGPLADLRIERTVAVGESQSALALTSYVNGVHPLAGLFDAFLVHSRPGTAAPLGEPGRSFYAEGRPAGQPTRIRDDVTVPVIVLQTETDVLGFLDYLPARQPDTDWLRVWEVAGTAHADKFQIGDFEEFLSCGAPVNRGQHVYVVRAALRHLVRWVRDGVAAPSAGPLEVGGREFVLDEVGNVRGGVRTPAVDVPTMVHTGLSAPDAPMMCRLFGSSTPLPAERLAALYPSRAGYLAAYEEATDRAVEAGFVLPEDRAAVLGEADPSVGE